MLCQITVQISLLLKENYASWSKLWIKMQYRRRLAVIIIRLTGSLIHPQPLILRGVFEVMIKSAKRALTAVLKDADVTDEKLQAAMCGAESFLNSRPITYVSSDSNDLTPLTPNHFIVGQLGDQFAPEASELQQVYNLRKRWHRIQQLIGNI